MAKLCRYLHVLQCKNVHDFDCAAKNMTSSAYNPLRSSAPPEYKSCHENVALLHAELTATSDERNMLRREVEHLRSCVDNGRQLSAAGSESRPVHSYEWLKAQCDEVMDELHMLQQQHSDMVDTSHI